LARVFIPPLLRARTGGLREIELEGATIGALLLALEAGFPGTRERLVFNERLMPGMAVIVDGEAAVDGLKSAVGPASEVHFVPAARGG